MKEYKFRKIILHDPILLIFFLFLFINFASYLTATLFGVTLVPLRIAFLTILMLLLVKAVLQFQTIDKIKNKYLFLFLFFYTISFIVNLNDSDPFFFFSVFFSLITFSLFIEYLDIHYSIVGKLILLDIIFYSLLIFPILLILNPWYISLNLYGSNAIESIGLKSRYLGWSCAIIYGILLFKIKKRNAHWPNKVLIFVLFFFVIISGSRSSLLSILLVTLFYFMQQRNKIKYIIIILLTVGFSGILFSSQIGSYYKKVSFLQRQEKKEIGLSDESYRGDILIDALTMSWENLNGFIFGFGPGEFKETLSKYYVKYRYNELSSHNTYLEVFITSGVLSFISFFFLYVVFPLKSFYFKKKELLYVFMPVVLIAATEDNFGLGQFLFVIFSLLAFYSYKI
jgi:O-antigen ligase